jgi:aspartate carbamoyltransferase catalytic subunit
MTNAAPPTVAVPAETTYWRRRHVLDLDDFTADEINLVMETADAMKDVLARDVPRVPALRGITCATVFYEASTRTRASFELAGKILGADVLNLSASGSSVEKGESIIDTVRTLQALGIEILIMRHRASGAPYLAAQHLGASVINAGDGWHAHPTQALLDIYTLRARFGDLRGRRIVIVGDITHSRVARSDMWGFTRVGAEVVISGPPTLLPLDLDTANDGIRLPAVIVEPDFDQAIAGADVVMALRLQAERQQAGLLPSVREYVRLYQVNSARLERARPGVLVMHPGPMNEGIEIAPDVAHGALSLIEDQVTNGVAVRMALLYLLAQRRRAGV